MEPSGIFSLFCLWIPIATAAGPVEISLDRASPDWDRWNYGFNASPGAIANVSYEWDLSGLAETVVAVGVFFQTAGPHSSLDAVSLDINVVPAPAALALFGLAAVGGRRRR